MFLVENNTYNKELIKPYEALMSIGNGYLNLRASFEFDVAFTSQNDVYMRFPDNVTLEKPRNVYGKWGTFISGVIGNHPLLNEEMVNLPYFMGFNLYYENNKIEILSDVKDFKQTLDMKSSIYSYELTFTYDNEEFTILSKRVCDRENSNYCNQEIVISTLSEKTFKLESFVDASVTTNGYNHFEKYDINVNDGYKNVKVTTDLNSIVEIAQRDICNGKFEIYLIKNNRVSNFFTFEKSVSLEKVTFIKTNRDYVENDIENYKFNLENHLQGCNEIWEKSDVIIEGDKDIQKYVRFAIYHLNRSKKRDDEFVAIDAKGVCGEAYFGHYFWDTEIYLLPFYLYTNPKYAKELLMFRYNTLKEAISNAKSYGYDGAKFPWESSISGNEQCSNWQYKDFEIHVSFDIVYAMYQYYIVTEDKVTMREKFIDVLCEVSKFICSRVSLQKDNKFHLKGVMGPDEYLAFTNDNAFTNYMAKFVLKKTVELLKEFNIEEDSICNFQNVSENFYLPIDTSKKMIWQCAGFDEFEDVDFEKVWLNREEPFGRFISQEKNYRVKALKQGDVTCLLYLFEKSFDREYLKNAMDYYLPITTHDSSLSYIIHSVLFSKLENKEDALKYFTKSCEIDFINNECGEGIHIANCGGIYQSIIYGFAGLVNPMFTEKLEFKPQLPDNITEIKFNMNYKNKVYKVSVTNCSCDVDIKEI
ncbi:MAG: glycosyl hydrolase family 65 protein [Lachnospirales bacterium]